MITAGPNGEAIQSTGTAFANIGVITIDNATKKIVGNELKASGTRRRSKARTSPSLTTKRAMRRSPRPQGHHRPIDKAYGEKFAVSKVTLNGAKAPDATVTPRPTSAT